MNRIKAMSPLVDLIFSCTFQDMRAEEGLRGFLNSVLKRCDDFQIEKIVEIKSQYTAIGENYSGKSTRLDVRVMTDEGALCDLEVQIENQGYIVNREVYYGSQLVTEKVKRGEAYKAMPNVRVISILDFDPDREEGEESGTLPPVETHEIVRRRTGHVSTDIFKIHHVLLPRMEKNLTLSSVLDSVKMGDNLTAWLYAFTKGYMDKKEMKSLEEVVPGMDNFNENYGRATEDELLEMRLRLQESEIFEARLREEARTAKIREEIALNFLKIGNNVNDISKACSLSVKEVEKLKEKLRLG